MMLVSGRARPCCDKYEYNGGSTKRMGKLSEMNFIPALAIRFRITNSCIRWRGIFKRLSQDGGRADFSKNLLASLFNKDLSKEPNFGQIHLAGQYLYRYYPV